MTKFKFTIWAIGIALAFVDVIGVNINAKASDAAWAMPANSTEGFHSVLFQDQNSEQYSYLVLQNHWNDVTKNPLCGDVFTSACTTQNYEFSSLLPQCTSDTDNNCISGFGAIKPDGTRIKGVFNNYFPLHAQNEYKGYIRLPSGASGSLYTIPGVSHSGGENFYVGVNMTGFSGTPGGMGSTAMLNTFSAQIVPVGLEKVSSIGSGCGPGICPNAGFTDFKYPDGTTRWVPYTPQPDGIHSCVATSSADSMCAQRYDFPNDLRFYLEVRVIMTPYGWIYGRLSNPAAKVTYTSSNDGSNAGVETLYFEGAPVKTPIIYKGYKWADMPEGLRSQYNSSTGEFLKGGQQGFGNNPGHFDKPTDPLVRNWTSTPAPNGVASIDELKAWLPYIDDKAVALQSTWSVHTLDHSQIGSTIPCYANVTQVSGIVTTNSTVYSPGPPEFDPMTGTLNYVVGAPHYTPTDEVFKGNYDLLIPSKVARCIYGFTDAPIKATISVASADGSPQVATTVVNEADGWLHMRASNFEFSTPIIKVKLTQDAPVVAAPTATPASAAPSAKKSTINCVKGKTSKVVTAIKPTCPTGYKKK